MYTKNHLGTDWDADSDSAVLGGALDSAFPASPQVALMLLALESSWNIKKSEYMINIELISLQIG